MSPAATTAVEVSRDQVLAHRLRTQQLDRSESDPKALAVWELGLQESPAGSAALALAARLPGGWADVPDLSDARSWITAWATRGAPVVLPAGRAASFAAALWPADDADAVNRLAGTGQQFRTDGTDPVEALRVTAEAMAAATTEPTTKGEVSTEVSAHLPEAYITWCRPCQAHHLGDQLMRLAGLPAGLRLVPGASPATLAPIARWPGVPAEQSGADELAAAYLHLCGPATPAELGTFLGTSGKAVKHLWPDDAVPVRVEGRKAWIAPDDLDDLTSAEPTEGLVRVLPRSDPWLLAKDRNLIVPDAAVRKVLWPTLGWPGAVLVDGEVAAAWRTRSSAKVLTVTVEPFGRLTKPVRAAIAEEAEAVAAQRDRPLDLAFA